MSKSEVWPYTNVQNRLLPQIWNTKVVIGCNTYTNRYTQKHRNTRGCKQKYILSAVCPYKAPPSLVLHHRWPRSSTAPGCYNAFINTNTNTTQIQIQYKHKKIDTGKNTSTSTSSCDNRLRWGAESLVLSNVLPIFVVRWTSNSVVMQFF